MKLAAAAGPLRQTLFAAALIASAASAWAQPRGIIGAGSAEAQATVIDPPGAASVATPMPPTAETAKSPQDKPSGTKTSRQLMLLMLIDRVRQLGPFGRLGQ